MSQSTGKTRESSLEQFYTHPDIAKSCVALIPKSADYVWIEPSAGTGSFSSVVENCIAMDIDPKHETIIKQDFLEWIPTPGTKYVVFGNPPFGKQSSLAKKFIKHACSFADVIAFILPRSFVKPSMNCVFYSKFHCILSVDIQPYAFIVNSEPYDVPSVFQIWKRHDTDRPIADKVKEVGFSYVKKDEEYDFVVRRVGVNAGKCFLAGTSKISAQSHYFIKLHTGNIEKILEEFNSHEFPSNTVGPRSLSKSEINVFLNKFTSV
jgi:predicted RNA methylase